MLRQQLWIAVLLACLPVPLPSRGEAPGSGPSAGPKP